MPRRAGLLLIWSIFEELLAGSPSTFQEMHANNEIRHHDMAAINEISPGSYRVHTDGADHGHYKHDVQQYR
jgi:hypothetical protein